VQGINYCAQDNELYRSIKGREFRDPLNDDQNVNDDDSSLCRQYFFSFHYIYVTHLGINTAISFACFLVSMFWFGWLQGFDMCSIYPKTIIHFLYSFDTVHKC
jgi:hypothetical protein